MKKIIKFLIRNYAFVIVFLLLVLPVFSFAAQDPPTGLVPCGTTTHPEPCEFKHFMTLINKVINFILFYLAVPIAAIMFAYAGFLLVTAGGEAASARTKAKSIFGNALIGLVFAAAAWLIIRTILSILGYDGAWIGF